MSLSTSSFSPLAPAAALPAVKRAARRPRARWLKALLLTAAVLIGAELWMRHEVGSVSRDFQLYQTYPDRAAELARHDGLRVAFVGNSALQEGLDLPVFRQELAAATGRPVAADSFYATHSYVNTWYHVLDHYFWQEGRAPDAVVVLYFDNNLADGNEMELGRVAWCFTAPRDWQGVCETDLSTYGQRLDFLLSSQSLLWAMRDRVKDRVLDRVCPGYAAYRQEVNALNFAEQKERAGGRAAPPTYRALERLVARAGEAGSRLYFVAFPTLVPDRAEAYSISAEERRIMEAGGMALVDLRHVPGLSADLYATRTHLNAAGRPVFSRHLALALAPVVPHAGQGTPTANR